MYRPRLKPSFKANKTLTKLQAVLSLKPKDFNLALSLPEEEKYTRKEIAKSTGGVRVVYNPHDYIRKIQSRLNTRIFAEPGVITWPDHLFGSIPNQVKPHRPIQPKDYVACASMHPRAKSVLNADVKNFFDNVSAYRVEEIFRTFFGFDDALSRTLAKICCFDDHLVQGGLTSSYLAALVLHDVEGDVVRRLAHKRIRYTRYVDDITISSTQTDYDFSLELKLVNDMLSEKELSLNADKTKINSISTESLSAHGLLISFEKPKLPSQEVAKIRAAVQQIEKLAKRPNARTTQAFRNYYNRCLGRVNKLMRLNHPQHKKLLRRLAPYLPLPSEKDVSQGWIKIKKLEEDYPKIHGTLRYERRYNIAINHVNLINRSFCSVAKSMRQRLDIIRP